MDLRTDYPFWLLDQGILASYPSLEKNVTAEVAIIGAGISGALIAWQLCKAGIKCTIVDRRHVGMGSTAATTGLLQYEIDTPLTELSRKIGLSNASDSYLLCAQAIEELEKLSRKHKQAGFTRHPSFQYASFKKDVGPLRKEYVLRKSIGLQLDWMDEDDIKHTYGFSKPAGLLSKQGAAVNAYGLTHALLKDCLTMGLEVYDQTEITSVIHRKRHIELTTKDKCKITARKVIVACGYESGAYLPKRVDQLSTTYAIVSEPFQDKMRWHQNSLIWETASPYLYLRTTQDHRIMMGGKDDEFSSAWKRERQLPKKVRSLEKAFKDLFPHIRWKTDFYWAGLFAGTKDGLPYIGSLPQRKNFYFALGFGGNGIVFSQIAATLLRDEIMGKENEHSRLFRFER